MSNVSNAGKMPGKKTKDGPAIKKAEGFTDHNNYAHASPTKWKTWANENSESYFDRVESDLSQANFRD